MVNQHQILLVLETERAASCGWRQHHRPPSIYMMDENFPGKPRLSGFISDFRFSRVGVPQFFFSMKMTPQFILSTLKCNNMTPKALKLHLQSGT
jgi:hypothetical protein